MNTHTLRRTVLALSTTLAAAQLADAQAGLWGHWGSTGSHLGSAVACAGDVDGDGFDDILIGAPRDGANGANAGRVEVRSGAAAFLVQVYGSAGDQFGTSVDSVGDLDGDGRSEFIVGAPNHDGVGQYSGRAIVFNSNGTVRFTVSGSAIGDHLGYRVAGVGDMNDDGTPDFAASAPWGNGVGTDRGYVRFYSGTNGVAFLQLNGTLDFGAFGWSLAGAGDVNHDGIPDAIVSSSIGNAGHGGQGYVRVIAGGTFATLYQLNGAMNSLFGYSVDGAGDVNGDGWGDFVVGVRGDDSGGTDAGAAIVYSGATGGVLRFLQGTQPGEHFGHAVAGIGDYDVDGRPDVMVGAPEYSSGLHVDEGRAAIHSGASGALLMSFTPGGDGLRTGAAVSGAGHVNADAPVDFIIANPDDSSFFQDGGSVGLYLGSLPYPTGYCTAKVNSQGCTPIFQSSSAPSSSTGPGYALVATNVLNNKSGLLFYGSAPAAIPFEGGTLCVAPPIVRTAVQNSGGSPSGIDCTGVYVYSFSSTDLAATFAVGDDVYAQYWSRDPGFAPPNNVGLTAAIHFTVLP